MVEKLESGLRRMKPRIDGTCTFIVTEDAQKKRSILFEEPDGGVDDAISIVGRFDLELYLIGDLKFLFMMLGRSGYSSSWCLYCKLKKAQWTDLHRERASCDCQGVPWTIDDIFHTALEQMQKDSDGVTYSSLGVKDCPLWSFIPLTRVLVPILHLLLGLANDMLENAWQWVEERVEPMTTEEIEARNMSLLAEIAFDDAQNKLENAIVDLEFLILERIELNDKLKRERRQLTQEQKVTLTNQKAAIAEEEKECRKKRDELKKNVKNLRTALQSAKNMEAAVRKERGRAEKSLRNAIESDVLKKYLVLICSYHGGDIEGNSCRRLMRNGVYIFEDIASFIKEWIRGGSSQVTSEEIDEVCTAHGRLLMQMDMIFSIMHTRRGGVTELLLTTLQEQLDLVRHKWDEMGLSNTPKFHVLLNHAVPQLRSTGGFADMGEDHIERSHQSRERDRHRLSRMRDQDKAKQSQAKFQNLRILDGVKDIQERVAEFTRRKLKRAIPLSQEREEGRKTRRLERRTNNATLLSGETRGEIMLTPRERLKQDVRHQNTTNSTTTT
mgnify:CR=1 FL=1